MQTAGRVREMTGSVCGVLGVCCVVLINCDKFACGACDNNDDDVGL
jgi:hypothetical protein